MKKVLFTALALIGMSFGTANAQSCCNPEKKECKPKTCCPVSTECCDEDDKNLKSNKTIKSKARKSNERAIARKETIKIN